VGACSRHVSKPAGYRFFEVAAKPSPEGQVDFIVPDPEVRAQPRWRLVVEASADTLGVPIGATSSLDSKIKSKPGKWFGVAFGGVIAVGLIYPGTQLIEDLAPTERWSLASATPRPVLSWRAGRRGTRSSRACARRHSADRAGAADGVLGRPQPSAAHRPRSIAAHRNEMCRAVPVTQPRA